MVCGVPQSVFDAYRNREDFCRECDGNVSVALHVLPFDVMAAVLNPLLRELCPASEMILMKLPSPEEGKASEYMKALRALVKDLPPMLLMNSSTHLPVITRYISSLCSTNTNKAKELNLNFLGGLSRFGGHLGSLLTLHTADRLRLARGSDNQEHNDHDDDDNN